MRIPMPNTRRRARIEIIPLIDIIFFLLATFVMVSLSMVKNQGIRVNLPSAGTGMAQEEHTSVTITVTQNGIYYLNKDAMTLEEITSRLSEIKSAAPDTIVIINGDEKSFFGDAIGVLDEVRRIGIPKVTIQTKSKSSPPADTVQ